MRTMLFSTELQSTCLHAYLHDMQIGLPLQSLVAELNTLPVVAHIHGIFDGI